MTDKPVGIFCAVDAMAKTPASTNGGAQKIVPAHITDAVLEAAITVAHTRVITAVTKAECHEACRELESLVEQRSTDRVRFMERIKGLR